MGRAYRIAMLGLKLIGCTNIKAPSGLWHFDTCSEGVSYIGKIFEVFLVKEVFHTSVYVKPLITYPSL